MSSFVEMTIEQGATLTSSITIADVNGTPRNLTGYTPKAQLRKSYYSNTAIDFVVSMTDAANGEFMIILDSIVTANLSPGRMLYDVTIRNTDNPPIVERLFEGVATILGGVTKQ